MVSVAINYVLSLRARTIANAINSSEITLERLIKKKSKEKAKKIKSDDFIGSSKKKSNIAKF